MLKDISPKNLRIDGNSVILFYLEGCSPCEGAIPVLEKIEATYGNLIPFFKIDFSFLDEYTDLKNRFKINSYPSLVFVEGGKLRLIHEGFSHEEEYVEQVCDFIESIYRENLNCVENYSN